MQVDSYRRKAKLERESVKWIECLVCDLSVNCRRIFFNFVQIPIIFTPSHKVNSHKYTRVFLLNIIGKLRGKL